MSSALTLCALAALTLAACGDPAPPPRACLTAGGGDVIAALAHAPRDVALADGTPLSTCVARALDDADLEVLGAPLAAAADRLAHAERRAGAAAFRLGFLIGAVERGAAGSGGVAAELVARLRQAAGDGGSPRRHAALLRGEAAGRRGG